MKANPAKIVTLGQATLAAASTLGDEQRRTQADRLIPTAAFGRFAAADVSQSFYDLSGNADNAVQTIVQVYDVDVDSLYQASASYQYADEHSAGLLHKLDPLSWF